MSTKHLTTILSIAGSDPMGGAGVQADVRIGSAFGVHVVTAITTVTAQNSKDFMGQLEIPSDWLQRQLESIKVDVIPDAIKIGMVSSVKNAEIIADFIKSLPSMPVVTDPVYKATSSNVFKNFSLKSKYLKIYNEVLFPVSSVITPNLIEFKKLFGEEFNPDKDLKAYLNESGVQAIVVKGGHSKEDLIKDYLIQNNNIDWFSHNVIPCHNLHGTGCAFSTLLAVNLALGKKLNDAFLETTKTLDSIISKSCDYRLGSSVNGPLNINDYILK